MSNDNGEEVVTEVRSSVLAGPQGDEGGRSAAERNGVLGKTADEAHGETPDPEVSANPKRRRFPASYKARVVYCIILSVARAFFVKHSA